MEDVGLALRMSVTMRWMENTHTSAPASLHPLVKLLPLTFIHELIVGNNCVHSMKIYVCASTHSGNPEPLGVYPLLMETENRNLAMQHQFM